MAIRRLLLLSAIVVIGRAAVVHAQLAPTTLSALELAAACAPSEGVPPAPAEGLRILGVQDTSARFLSGSNDLVVLGGGTQSGVRIDQEYFIRRPFAFGWRRWRAPSGMRPQSIHTAGWLRIVAVNETTSIARIQMACDGVMAGDYLEPFATPAAVAEAAPGTAATLDFSSLGRIKFGDEERRLGSVGDFMLVDAGSAALTPGVQVSVYRDLEVRGLPLAAVAQGVIVAVANGTPVMRISSARDAIQSGDYVVRHK